MLLLETVAFCHTCTTAWIIPVDITGGQETLNGVYSVIGQHSGTIVDASSISSSDTIKASVPVRCTSGMVGSFAFCATRPCSFVVCLQLAACAWFLYRRRPALSTRQHVDENVPIAVSDSIYFVKPFHCIRVGRWLAHRKTDDAIHNK